MTKGLLGKATSQANTNVTAYTVPTVATEYANASILIANLGNDTPGGGGVDDTVNVYIASGSGAPSRGDLIDASVTVPLYGSYERTCVLMSPGERVIVKGTTANLAIRVHGLEKST
jgi:hypothetical protein